MHTMGLSCTVWPQYTMRQTDDGQSIKESGIRQVYADLVLGLDFWNTRTPIESFLPLDESVASRAVFVTVSWGDGGRQKRFWNQLNK